MPRTQSVSGEQNVLHPRESPPEVSKPVFIFRGNKERSKTEGLPRLLLPRQWERVERLRRMRRARKETAEARVEHEEPDGETDTEANGVDHREAQQDQPLNVEASA